MGQLYKITLAVKRWIQSLAEDKHNHIISNMLLASAVAVTTQLVGGSMPMAFVIVLVIGLLLEIRQTYRGASLRDGMEDLAANMFGAGCVFLPWLI